MQGTSTARARLTDAMVIAGVIHALKPGRDDYTQLAMAIRELQGQDFSPSELAIEIHEIITGIDAQEGCDLIGLVSSPDELGYLLWKGLTIVQEDEDLPFERQLHFALMELFVL